MKTLAPILSIYIATKYRCEEDYNSQVWSCTFSIPSGSPSAIFTTPLLRCDQRTTIRQTRTVADFTQGQVFSFDLGSHPHIGSGDIMMSNAKTDHQHYHHRHRLVNRLIFEVKTANFKSHAGYLRKN